MNRSQQRTSFLKVFFPLILILLLFLPGTTLLAAGGNAAGSLQEGVTPTPTFTATPTPVLLTAYDGSVLEAFIQVPLGVVAQPYIVLDAVELGAGAEIGTIVLGDQRFSVQIVPGSPPMASP